MLMQPNLDDVCAASLPAASLGALADLRCVPGVSVVLAAERAWLRWPAGQERVLERVLAVPGVELFVRRAGGWARLGSWLPAGPVPLEQPGQPLAQVLTPAPVQPVPPRRETLSPVRLKLVRSDDVRETSALRCRAADLLGWSDQVPTSRFVQLEGVRLGADLFVTGRRLPEVAGERYCGSRLLLPLGWRAEPDLPEHAWPEALGLAKDELLLFTAAGAEVLSREAFQPLTRAALRLVAEGEKG